MASYDLIKLNRVAAALTDASRAGATGSLWPVFAAALPGVLPRPNRSGRPGLPDLIALATQAAEAAGARDPIQGLPEVAARSRSSRLSREATRLHRVLAGPADHIGLSGHDGGGARL